MGYEQAYNMSTMIYSYRFKNRPRTSLFVESLAGPVPKLMTSEVKQFCIGVVEHNQ